jgi:hypothetical protein
MHAPLSETVGSSPVCTVPPRPSSVTDAGCGMAASCAAAVALSGAMTKAREGDSAATNNKGPALKSQFRDGVVVVESVVATGVGAVESIRTGGFPRSHAMPVRAAPNHKERRNRFI